MKKVIAILMALLLHSNIVASAVLGNALECTVKGVYKIDGFGKIVALVPIDYAAKNSEINNRHVLGSLVDEKFIVNRNDGVFRMVSMKNTHLDVVVIDKGSNVQSLKVLSSNLTGYIHVQYLQVDVYGPEVNKPFRIIDNEIIVTGFCNFL
jgi:hypothetical protein